MTIKVSVFIATILNGLIARANGDLDWLTGTESAPTEQDYGCQEFMDTVDTIVLEVEDEPHACVGVPGPPKVLP